MRPLANPSKLLPLDHITGGILAVEASISASASLAMRSNVLGPYDAHASRKVEISEGAPTTEEALPWFWGGGCLR